MFIFGKKYCKLKAKKMKHTKVIELRNALSKINGLKGFEVNYSIEENLQRLELSIKPIAKQEKEINDIIKDFNEQRRVLGEKYSTVDGKVKYKYENGIQIYDIPVEKIEEYDSEVLKLKEKHKKPFKQFEEKMKEFIDFLETGDSTFKIHTVKSTHVPSDITTEQMKAIFPLIRVKEN